MKTKSAIKSALAILLSGICAASAADYRLAVLRDHPVGYWRLNELPGATSAADESTNRLAGTFHLNSGNSVLLGQAGVGGNSVLFSYGPGGASDYGCVSVPYLPVLSPVVSDTVHGAPYSAECWVAPSIGSPSDHLCPLAMFGAAGASPSASKSGWSFVEAPSSPATWQLWMSTDSGVQKLTAQAPVVAGQFYLLTATFDGNQAKFFVNGVAQATTPLAGYIAAPAGTAVTVGAGPAAGAAFTGWVDDVAFFAYALSAQQISNHFRVGNGRLLLRAQAAAAASASTPSAPP